jgi:GTPase SAR1 family protein
MIKLHYKGVHVCILVYDISEQGSFDSLEDWYQDVKEKL